MKYGDKLKTLIGKEGYLSTPSQNFTLFFNHPRYSLGRGGTSGTIKEVGDDFVVITAREYDLDEKETAMISYEIIIPLSRFFIQICPKL